MRIRYRLAAITALLTLLLVVGCTEPNDPGGNPAAPSSTTDRGY